MSEVAFSIATREPSTKVKIYPGLQPWPTRNKARQAAEEPPAETAEATQPAGDPAESPQAAIESGETEDRQALTTEPEVAEAPAAITPSDATPATSSTATPAEEAAAEAPHEASAALPRLETITPETARQWLDRNTKNRSVSQTTVDRYAQQMKAGMWHINGETIKFNVKGDLIDGQHRLHGVIKADKPIQAYVVYGLPVEAFKTIDRGRKRNVADDLGILGEANRTILSATLNLYYSWQASNLNSVKNGRSVTRSDDLIDILAEHPDIRKAVSRCNGSPFRKMVSASTLAFCYYLLANIDAEAAEAFFSKVELGTNLDITDPEYRLREKLTEIRAKRITLSKEETVALIFKAWNHRRQEKPMRSCNWARETEPFPYPV